MDIFLEYFPKMWVACEIRIPPKMIWRSNGKKWFKKQKKKKKLKKRADEAEPSLFWLSPNINEIIKLNMIFIKFHLQEQILQMQISSFLTRTREQAGHETLAQILKRRLQSPVCFWSCNYCTCLWRPQSDGHTRLSRQIDVNINIRGSVNIADVRQQAHKCNCSWAECDSSASESVFLALACWACWGFGAWEVFGEETRDDKWPQERCLVSSSVCVCMYCGLLILRRSRDQSAQGPTFYASVLNMQMQPVDFFFFFFFTSSFERQYKKSVGN